MFDDPEVRFLFALGEGDDDGQALRRAEATVEEKIGYMKANVFDCKKCGRRVSEYDSIGQWNCFEQRFHKWTGETYKVPSDHTQEITVKPPMVISIPMFMKLPPMQDEAYSVFKYTFQDGTEHRNVLVQRTRKDPGEFGKDFAMYDRG